MQLEMIDNLQTGGKSCYFQKGDEFYYADCSYVPFIGMETMIFPCDENHEVTSWLEVYCDRSGKSLQSCVDEFIASED